MWLAWLHLLWLHLLLLRQHVPACLPSRVRPRSRWAAAVSQWSGGSCRQRWRIRRQMGSLLCLAGSIMRRCCVRSLRQRPGVGLMLRLCTLCGTFGVHRRSRGRTRRRRRTRSAGRFVRVRVGQGDHLRLTRMLLRRLGRRRSSCVAGCHAASSRRRRLRGGLAYGPLWVGTGRWFG